MNYANIKWTDIANGPGVRISLFVSGCRNHCVGCFNPETWDFKYGKPFTLLTLNKIIEALDHDYIEGISILGGDPFERENITVITTLCQLIKQKYPQKTIWVYTGYKYEDYCHLEIMNYIDVLVDGRFVEKLKNISLRFKGSSNQRIIDVKASKLKKEIVLYEV